MVSQRDWIWRDEQPAAIVLVVLILALALFFPRSACRGRMGPTYPRIPSVVTQPAADEAPAERSQRVYIEP
jgi:hypothetical protein